MSKIEKKKEKLKARIIELENEMKNILFENSSSLISKIDK